MGQVHAIGKRLSRGCRYGSEGRLRWVRWWEPWDINTDTGCLGEVRKRGTSQKKGRERLKE